MRDGNVVANMSLSLDGFIVDRNDSVGPLFNWYHAGPVTTPSADEKVDLVPVLITHLGYRVRKPSTS
jgi:hypothetical protein